MKVRSFSRIFVALAATGCIAAPPSAQAAEPSSNAPCELHVWAAQEFSSLPFGNGLAPGLATMFPGNLGADSDSQFVEIASVNLQIEAVMRADPVASLGLPAGTEVIAHPETEDDKITKQRKVRRSASQAPCYYELHVSYSYLVEDIVWGDRFGTLFDLRQYREGPEWVFRHRGEGGNKLTVFPVKEDDDPAEVVREVSKAIEANFVEYAPKAKRNLERGSRRR